MKTFFKGTLITIVSIAFMLFVIIAIWQVGIYFDRKASIPQKLEKLKQKILVGHFDDYKIAMHNNQIARGKTPEEAKAYVASLEPQTQREKEKFLRYCDANHPLKYCKIEIDPAYPWSQDKSKISITYYYDNETFQFFNSGDEVLYEKEHNGIKDHFYRYWFYGFRIEWNYAWGNYNQDGFREVDYRHPISREKVKQIGKYEYILKEKCYGND